MIAASRGAPEGGESQRNMPPDAPAREKISGLWRALLTQYTPPAGHSGRDDPPAKHGTFCLSHAA
jgi:hypothetical protein